MINSEMTLHNYYTLGADNEYGQPQMPTLKDTPKGQIKIAVFTSSTTTQDNINYKDANYIGLTRAKVDDTYVIENNGELLKVLYTNSAGRLTQVFLKKI